MKSFEKKTQESFGLQWRRYTHINREVEESVFFEKTGLKPEELDGKKVLDVGCGYGRYSYVALKHGAEVFSFDFSDAVYSAQENLESYPKFRIIKTDLFHMPFREETFDIIFSIGVLHHTPSTRRAFEALLPYLKKGGRMAIWVYVKRGEPFDGVNEMLRRVMTKIPQRLLYHVSWIASPLGLIYRPLMRLPIVGNLFVLFNSLFPISMNPDWRVRQIDTFDWWSPQYQHHHTVEEVKGWFSENGLEIVYVGDYPVSVAGIKK